MTIRFLAVPAPATRLTGVARVNQHERDAALLALVGQIGGELTEGPTAVRATLRPRNFYARAYAFKVFAPNSTPCGVSMHGYPLGKGVANIGLEPLLFLGSVLEQTASALRAFRLQLLPHVKVTAAYAQHACAAVHGAIARGSDVHNPLINTDNVNGRCRWDIGHVNGDSQTPAVLVRAVDQVALSDAESGGKLRLLVAAACPSKRLATIKGTQGHGGRADLTESLVVHDGASLTERVLAFLVGLVAIGDDANSAHGQLGRQPEESTRLVVGQTVNRNTPKLLRLPCCIADVLARRVKGTHGVMQCRALVSGRVERESNGTFHPISIQYPFNRCAPIAARERARTPFLPAVKDGVS